MDCSLKFPYQEFRRGQREVAEEVAKTVESGGMLVLRAPTGFGKTATLLYGALCSGAERILYLVRTVNEVDPVLRELRRLGVPHVFLYSARRMCPLFPPDHGLTAEEFWSACRLARLRGECEYYSRLEEVEPDEVLKAVSSPSQPQSKAVVRFLARELGVCPFFALRSALDHARVVVATYPYLFRPDIFRGVMDPYDYSDFVIIVDEAHSLAEIHSLLEKRITLEDVESAIHEIRQHLRDPGVAIDILQGLRKALKDAARAARGVSRIDKERLSGILDDAGIISDVAEEVRQKQVEEALLSGSRRIPKGHITRVEAWLLEAREDWSHIFVEAPGDEPPEFVTTPLDPSIVAREPLEKARAVMLASGTLPEGDFTRELLGVARPASYIDTELLYGSFVPHSNIYTIVDASVTTRYRERTPEMYRRIATRIALVARLLPGLKLVVYPSYEVMGEIVKRLPVDLPVIVESRSTNLAEVQARIEEEVSLVINAVAGGKLVEGVEFVVNGENLLHTVVVVGVPYPQPDAYTLSRIEVLDERLGRRKARYYVYEFSTAVKVRQALGRATRSPDDRAVYVLLDRRFLRKDLRRLIGLRPTRVVSSLEGLRAALGEARRAIYGYSSSRKDSIAS